MKFLKGGVVLGDVVRDNRSDKLSFVQVLANSGNAVFGVISGHGKMNGAGT